MNFATACIWDYYAHDVAVRPVPVQPSYMTMAAGMRKLAEVGHLLN